MHWTKAKASNVSIAAPKPAQATAQAATRSLAGPARCRRAVADEPPHAAPDEPEHADEADEADRDERVQVLVVEDDRRAGLRVDDRARRRSSARSCRCRARGRRPAPASSSAGRARCRPRGPEPTSPARAVCEWTSPPLRQERVVEAAERVRRGEVDGDDAARSAAGQNARTHRLRTSSADDRHREPPSGRPCARRSSSAPTTRVTPAAAQKQAPAGMRAREARYAASGIAIVSAAPSAIGCWAEARTRSRVRRVRRLLDRAGRLEEREPLVQVVEDVVVRPRLVDRRDRDRRRAEHERPHHQLGRRRGSGSSSRRAGRRAGS